MSSSPSEVLTLLHKLNIHVVSKTVISAPKCQEVVPPLSVAPHPGHPGSFPGQGTDLAVGGNAGPLGCEGVCR